MKCETSFFFSRALAWHRCFGDCVAPLAVSNEMLAFSHESCERLSVRVVFVFVSVFEWHALSPSRMGAVGVTFSFVQTSQLAAVLTSLRQLLC